MPNIKSNYRYRDSANYKNNGFLIFSNPQSIKLEFLEYLIRSKLIDDLYFYASKWDIPNLFFLNPDLESDPTWHEFDNIEYTNEQTSTAQSLPDFIRLIEQTRVI